MRRVALVAVALALAGCETVQVSMAPRVGALELAERVPGGVALLVTEETRAALFSGKPDSLTGSSITHRFPMGTALESAATQAFSQVFREVTLVRTREAAKTYSLVLEPRVTDFHFAYDALHYAGFATAATARARVQVTAARGDAVVVWSRTVESPEQRRGPFKERERVRGASEAASAALAAALAQLATEAASNPAVRQALAP